MLLPRRRYQIAQRRVWISRRLEDGSVFAYFLNASCGKVETLQCDICTSVIQRRYGIIHLGNRTSIYIWTLSYNGEDFISDSCEFFNCTISTPPIRAKGISISNHRLPIVCSARLQEAAPLSPLDLAPVLLRTNARSDTQKAFLDHVYYLVLSLFSNRNRNNNPRDLDSGK